MYFLIAQSVVFDYINLMRNRATDGQPEQPGIWTFLTVVDYLGVSPSTLQRMDALLKPKRTPGGRRHYDPRIVVEYARRRDELHAAMRAVRAMVEDV